MAKLVIYEDKYVEMVILTSEGCSIKKLIAAGLLATTIATSGCSILDKSVDVTQVTMPELVSVAANYGVVIKDGAKAFYDCSKQQLYIAQHPNITVQTDVLKSCGRAPDRPETYGIDSYSGLRNMHKPK